MIKMIGQIETEQDLESHKGFLLASKLFTARQLEVVVKRIRKKALTQVEANYLSRFIRPKIQASRYITELKLYELVEDPRKKTFAALAILPRVFVNGAVHILQER